MANRSKDKRFKRDYTREDILQYLNGIHGLLGRAPAFREIQSIPGPAARTIVRRFGTWNKALRSAGIRPQSKQLVKGEKSYIRSNWRKMTDTEISKKLGVSFWVIRYYRMNLKMWKNRKGTAKSTFRKKALRLYGEECECCGIKMCEWHHIVPKSKNPKDWLILCPTCHAAITRKAVTLRRRSDLKLRLVPFIKNLYAESRISWGSDSVYT